MKEITIYQEWIPIVGGIETATYTLAKLFVINGYKTTLYFKGCENECEVLKYGEHADLIRYEGQPIKTDVFINMSNYQLPADLEAKKKIQIIHSDYEKYALQLLNKEDIDQYIAVSQNSADVIKRLEGVDVKVIYNLVDPDFKSCGGLRLVTNTRISPEKGFDRMLQLCELFKKYKIDFQWLIYGNNSQFPQYEVDIKWKFRDFDEVNFMGFKKDIKPGLEWADYLVLLSDFEGCPYAVLEALKLSTPCILSDYKGSKELIRDGVNGYILPMDMEITKAKLERLKKIPKVTKKVISKFSDWEAII